MSGLIFLAHQNKSALTRPAFSEAGDTDALHVAVVHASDGVRHVAVSTTRDSLIRNLAEYVKRKAFEQLLPCHAVRVDEALRDADPERAIALYFAQVGARWDQEFLHTQVINER
jgi:hypothetical protein